MTPPSNLQAIRDLAAVFPGLRLLVLHGSRARGDTHQRSDWDFAYLGQADLDELELRRQLSASLDADNIDVADLSRAGGLLRYRVAKDGALLYEQAPGTFENFCCKAAAFWFDVADIVRDEHDSILEALG
jgi:predicted nucleotidyltransferase